MTGKIKISIKKSLSDNQPDVSFPLEKEESYLKDYLSSIKNKKNNKYKRIIISPLRYAGGKTNAIGLILDNLPKLKQKRIVSPFFGGGSFELCVSQMLDIEVIGYDIFEMLTNFWDVLIHHKSEFVTELRKLVVSTDEFTKNRHILLSYWDKVKPSDLVYHTKKQILLTENEKSLLDNNKILQAVYYYYNMSLSYGPMFLGWPSSHEINADSFARKIGKLEQSQFKNLSVQCDDFKNVISRHNKDFLFLDPPYFLGHDSKMFKGIYPNSNFAIHHNNFEHQELLELLKNHQGGFFLTYNRCDTICEWYREYHQVFPEWNYTYGQGEKRIGVNRLKSNSSNIKESHEIFIICPPK